MRRHSTVLEKEALARTLGLKASALKYACLTRAFDIVQSGTLAIIITVPLQRVFVATCVDMESYPKDVNGLYLTGSRVFGSPYYDTVTFQFTRNGITQTPASDCRLYLGATEIVMPERDTVLNIAYDNVDATVADADLGFTQRIYLTLSGFFVPAGIGEAEEAAASIAGALGVTPLIPVNS